MKNLHINNIKLFTKSLKLFALIEKTMNKIIITNQNKAIKEENINCIIIRPFEPKLLKKDNIILKAVIYNEINVAPDINSIPFFFSE